MKLGISTVIYTSFKVSNIMIKTNQNQIINEDVRNFNQGSVE